MLFFENFFCVKKSVLFFKVVKWPKGNIKKEAIKAHVIGPLHDPVTWYGINYTGTQIMQWDFQNKGKSGWTGKSSFVLEVPLRHLRPSVIYSVPCDQILQRAYWCLNGICNQFNVSNHKKLKLDTSNWTPMWLCTYPYREPIKMKNFVTDIINI